MKLFLLYVLFENLQLSLGGPTCIHTTDYGCTGPFLMAALHSTGEPQACEGSQLCPAPYEQFSEMHGSSYTFADPSGYFLRKKYLQWNVLNENFMEVITD